MFNVLSEAASNEEFRKNLLAPADRGGDPYTQWLSRLRNMAAVMESQEMKKFFVSCLEYLRVSDLIDTPFDLIFIMISM